MIITENTQLVLARDLPDKLIADVKAAKKHIAITVATFHNDCSEIEELLTELENAASRGVAVSLMVDTLTYTEIRDSIFKQQRRGLQALKLERRMKQAGVVFQWLGKNTPISFLARTHCKWMIIDDIIYSFGGVNLDEASFTNIDYMLRIQNPELAENLLDVHFDISTKDRSSVGVRNVTFSDDKSTVIIDGGMPLNSEIYRRCVELAKKSKKIVIVSQYGPTGRLMRLANRCKKSIFYFNKIRNATFLNSIMLSFSLLNHKYNSYQKNQYLHAKFIIFTLKNNKKVAVLGSHNFVNSTGIVGTREIALETTDQKVIKMLEYFIQQEIKS